MRYLSLFDGIGAVHVAAQPMGWTCVATAEIESFPAAVVEHRFPGIPNLGDVTKITDAQIAALGLLDLVVGGSPCQDLSVAGKQCGLSGERSRLFHEQVRIFHAARHLCGARYLLWENVPGAFSTNGGRDFAIVVGALAGCVLNVSAGGWRNAGVALGTHGLVEWCVLDAQFFGVAQRRRRVFALLDTGNWAGRGPVLLEPESLQRHPAPRRESRQEFAAATAPSLTASGRGVARPGESRGQDPVVAVSPTLRAGGNKTGGDRPPGTDVDTCDSLICMSSGQANAEIQKNVSTTLTTLHEAPIVAHALRGEGFDASEDGAGRGTTLVCAEVGQTLTSGGRGERGRMDPVNTDLVASFKGGQGSGAGSIGYSEHLAPTLPSSDGGNRTPTLMQGMQVRRLTPRECERLQGFPDDYTLIPVRGKPAADGPRYKALGNSMAVPVVRWIFERLARAHRSCADEGVDEWAA